MHMPGMHVHEAGCTLVGPTSSHQYSLHVLPYAGTIIEAQMGAGPEHLQAPDHLSLRG